MTMMKKCVDGWQRAGAGAKFRATTPNGHQLALAYHHDSSNYDDDDHDDGDDDDYHDDDDD